MSDPKLLLIGSSIMEQWREPATLAPGWQVVNRAIGGTTTAYWCEHFASVLDAEQPQAVLAYVGSNDFAQEVPAAVIRNNLQKCREILHYQQPEVSFGYLAIIKAPQRLGRFLAMAALNTELRSVLAPGDLWLESDPVFLNGDEPISRHYIEDGLHLTPQAYLELEEAVRPQIATWLAQAHLS